MIEPEKRKATQKARLQTMARLPLRPDVLLVGMLGRMVQQKGFDLILGCVQDLLNLDLQLCVHGSGEARYELELNELARRVPDKMTVSIGFNQELGEAILAGSDALLIASIYEPCGVVSIWGREFGTVPIVYSSTSRTFVADATIESFAQEEATGIVFNEATPQALLGAVVRTLDLYGDKNKWSRLSQNNRDLQKKPLASAQLPMEPLPLVQGSLTTDTTLPLRVLDTLAVRPDTAIPRIEFCVGDVTNLRAADHTDVLIVSAYPDTYDPLPGSLIAALHGKGIDVAKLAMQKEVDLREAFSCWLSRDIGNAHSGIHVHRILCYEPYVKGTPEELVGDIFRSLAPFVCGSPFLRTVAAPVVASGYQGVRPDRMLRLLVETALQWMRAGMPLDCVKIVAFPGQEASVLHDVFLELKHDLATNVGIPRLPNQYDCFISYAHTNVQQALALESTLRKIKPRIRLFVDLQQLDTGAAWQQHIYESLDRCAKVIALLTPDYLRSKVCMEEFNIAHCRSRESDRHILAPFYLYTSILPTYMKLVQFWDCREGDVAKVEQACWSLLQELPLGDG
jgi:hypothetical protein